MRAVFAFLACLSFAAPALGVGAPGANDPSVVVGIVTTLTGPRGIAGQDVADGFAIALKELGGRFANQEVRVVVVDDKGSPDVALQQVAKTLQRDRLDVVVTALAPSSLAAVLPSLTRAHLFVLNVADAPESLTGKDCSPWYFEVGAPPYATAEVLGSLLVAEKMKKVAVVGPEAGPTGHLPDSLRRSFPGVTDVMRVGHGASNYVAQLRHVAESRPDAVVSVLTGGMGTAFLRQWGESGLKGEIPVYADWQSLERPILPALGDGALDLLSVATWSPDIDNPVNKRLQTDFELEYGRPSTVWASRGYDAALVLDAALKVTGGRTADTDQLRHALRHVDLVSSRGPFRFHANHTPVQNFLLRRVVRDAKGRLTNETRQVAAKDWRDAHAQSCPMRWDDSAVTVVPALPKKP
jgi:branched-chain amino acid transport system substrate-binding protein